MRLCLLCLLVLTCDNGAEEVQREWARFAGVWERTAYESDGRKVPTKNAERFRLTLRANGTYAVHVDGKLVVEGTARLDPAQTPKTIDMTPATGRSKGQTLRGIYELNGDEYRICYALAGAERPRKFVAAAGTGQVLASYRREKQ